MSNVDAKISTSSNLKSLVDVKHRGVRLHHKATILGHLKMHTETMHRRLKDYSCDECDAKLSTSSSLKRYVNVMHRGVRHSCVQCAYKASSLNHLKLHIEAVHLRIRKHACGECDAKFSQSCHLRRHVDTKHRGVRYICQHCSFLTATKQTLKIHTESEHLNMTKYSCDQCGFRANLFHHLKRHVEAVHLKKFSCVECGFRAKFAHSLKVHTDAVHRNLRPYSCDRCRYKSATPSQMKRHVESVHLKLKPFKCDHCDHRASLSASLAKHIKLRHQKEPRARLRDPLQVTRQDNEKHIVEGTNSNPDADDELQISSSVAIKKETIDSEEDVHVWAVSGIH